MDTIAVIMTGLMLLVPPNRGSSGPTHVLMPATANLPTHATWIAFAGDSTDRCAHYAYGVCFVDMDGWSLDLSGGRNGTPDSDALPVSTLNLTRGSGGQRITRQHLSGSPGRKVRSRVVLAAGEIAGTCSLALWEFDPYGSPPRETIPLANTVLWKMATPSADSLELRRTRLDPEPGDTVEVLGKTGRGDSGYFEVVVVHVSLEEALAMLHEIKVTAAAPSRSPEQPPTGLPSRGHPQKPQRDSTPPDPATMRKHFNAYYDLLRVPQNAQQRPVPYFRDSFQPCSLRMTNRQRQALITGIRTHSCMIASALSN